MNNMKAHNYRKNGMTGTSTYWSWGNMKQRCLNKKTREYPRYGGRGISICKKWLTFDGFFEDMGIKPLGLTLERIDNNKGYSKKNCKWATHLEQNNNTSFNRYLTYLGKRQTLTAWSKETGLKITTIFMRLQYGWTLKKTLTKK